MASKRFDVVVFGATGFSGTLVARYLAAEPESALDSPTALQWAIAGRSKTKLEQVKVMLKEQGPSMRAELIDALPTIVADGSDEASLVAMVRQTKVVLSLVGPYGVHGSLLVKACAENGVHYCDLTAELVWMKEMIGKYQKAADQSGAILVNCCGYEAIPADLTTLLITNKIRQRRNQSTSRVDLYLTDFSGDISGGTFASLFAMVETPTTQQLLDSWNPFYLTDEATLTEKLRMDLVKPNETSVAIKFDKNMSLWSAVWLGGGVNQAIVHRSNFLKHEKYGAKLVVTERLAKGGMLMQLLVTIGSVALGVAMFFSWTRSLLKKLVPPPGQGPSEDTMQNGYITINAAGYSEDGQLAATGQITATTDPGYLLTSRMIVETAFCLAKGEIEPEFAGKGGFLTPACAVGKHLADRLQRKSILSFELADAQ